MTRDIVYSNKWFNVVEVTSSAESEPYYGLDTLDYVHILAITDQRYVLFVKQHRPLINIDTLELPGGHIERGQAPEEAAAAELLEETGYLSENMELLGVLQTDVGRLTNKLWCYLAMELSREKTWSGEKGIEVIAHPIKDISRLVSSGEIANTYNLAVFFLAGPEIINQ